MTTESQGAALKAAKRFTGWNLVAAVLFIVLGLFAVLEPMMAGLGIALLVGWLFIFGGVAHLVAAFQGGGAARVFFQVLAAIVFVLGGLYLLMNPLLALGTLTLFVAAVILAVGVCEIISYFRRRAEAGSGWLLLNGIVALLLGGLIWFHWPSSSVWAIGTLVGINLWMTGIARLMFGFAARRLLKSATG